MKRTLSVDNGRHLLASCVWLVLGCSGAGSTWHPDGAVRDGQEERPAGGDGSEAGSGGDWADVFAADVGSSGDASREVGDTGDSSRPADVRSDPSVGDRASDSGDSDLGSQPTPDAQACTALSNSAPEISSFTILGSANMGYVGGAVQDGTYELTNVSVYLTPGSSVAAKSLQRTIRISGNAASVEMVFHDVLDPNVVPVVGPVVDVTASGSLTISPGSLVLNLDCPVAVVTYKYAATRNGLTLFWWDTSQNEYVYVYTLRGSAVTDGGLAADAYAAD